MLGTLHWQKQHPWSINSLVLVMISRVVILVTTGKRQSVHLLRMSENMTNGKHWALMWSAVFSGTKRYPNTRPFLVISDLTFGGPIKSLLTFFYETSATTPRPCVVEIVVLERRISSWCAGGIGSVGRWHVYQHEDARKLTSWTQHRSWP